MTMKIKKYHRYSPVANPKIILKLLQKEIHSGYQLFLAHDVVNQKAVYEAINYRIPKDSLIIMDNSLIELGTPVTFEVMQNACKIIKPNFIVLPDKLLDREASVTMFKDYYGSWLGMINDTNMGFMAVLQGTNYQEMVQCAAEYIQMDYAKLIKAFAIPRAYANSMGTRRDIIQALNAIYTMPIHLLGMSDNIKDDLYCACRDNVIGIDSATPIRMGAENKRIDKYISDFPENLLLQDREKYFKETIDLNIEIIYNVGYLNGYLSYGE